MSVVLPFHYDHIIPRSIIKVWLTAVAASHPWSAQSVSVDVLANLEKDLFHATHPCLAHRPRPTIDWLTYLFIYLFIYLLTYLLTYSLSLTYLFLIPQNNKTQEKCLKQTSGITCPIHISTVLEILDFWNRSTVEWIRLSSQLWEQNLESDESLPTKVTLEPKSRAERWLGAANRDWF